MAHAVRAERGGRVGRRGRPRDADVAVLEGREAVERVARLAEAPLERRAVAQRAAGVRPVELLAARAAAQLGRAPRAVVQAADGLEEAARAEAVLGGELLAGRRRLAAAHAVRRRVAPAGRRARGVCALRGVDGRAAVGAREEDLRAAEVRERGRERGVARLEEALLAEGARPVGPRGGVRERRGGVRGLARGVEELPLRPAPRLRLCVCEAAVVREVHAVHAQAELADLEAHVVPGDVVVVDAQDARGAHRRGVRLAAPRGVPRLHEEAAAPRLADRRGAVRERAHAEPGGVALGVDGARRRAGPAERAHRVLARRVRARRGGAQVRALVVAHDAVGRGRALELPALAPGGGVLLEVEQRALPAGAHVLRAARVEHARAVARLEGRVAAVGHAEVAAEPGVEEADAVVRVDVAHRVEAVGLVRAAVRRVVEQPRGEAVAPVARGVLEEGQHPAAGPLPARDRPRRAPAAGHEHAAGLAVVLVRRAVQPLQAPVVVALAVVHEVCLVGRRAGDRVELAGLRVVHAGRLLVREGRERVEAAEPGPRERRVAVEPPAEVACAGAVSRGAALHERGGGRDAPRRRVAAQRGPLFVRRAGGALQRAVLEERVDGLEQALHAGAPRDGGAVAVEHVRLLERVLVLLQPRGLPAPVAPLAQRGLHGQAGCAAHDGLADHAAEPPGAAERVGARREVRGGERVVVGDAVEVGLQREAVRHGLLPGVEREELPALGVVVAVRVPPLVLGRHAVHLEPVPRKPLPVLRDVQQPGLVVELVDVGGHEVVRLDLDAPGVVVPRPVRVEARVAVDEAGMLEAAVEPLHARHPRAPHVVRRVFEHVAVVVLGVPAGGALVGVEVLPLHVHVGHGVGDGALELREVFAEERPRRVGAGARRGDDVLQRAARVRAHAVELRGVLLGWGAVLLERRLPVASQLRRAREELLPERERLRLVEARRLAAGVAPCVPRQQEAQCAERHAELVGVQEDAARVVFVEALQDHVLDARGVPRRGLAELRVRERHVERLALALERGPHGEPASYFENAPVERLGERLEEERARHLLLQERAAAVADDDGPGALLPRVPPPWAALDPGVVRPRAQARVLLVGVAQHAGDVRRAGAAVAGVQEREDAGLGLVGGGGVVDPVPRASERLQEV